MEPKYSAFCTYSEEDHVLTKLFTHQMKSDLYSRLHAAVGKKREMCVSRKMRSVCSLLLAKPTKTQFLLNVKRPPSSLCLLLSNLSLIPLTCFSLFFITSISAVLLLLFLSNPLNRVLHASVCLLSLCAAVFLAVQWNQHILKDDSPFGSAASQPPSIPSVKTK